MKKVYQFSPFESFTTKFYNEDKELIFQTENDCHLITNEDRYILQRLTIRSMLESLNIQVVLLDKDFV